MAYEIPNNNYNPYGYEPIQRPMIPGNGMMMQAPIPDTPFAIGDVANAIREVQKNPSNFSMEEINRARELSMQYLGKDIEFADDIGRTVANTLFDAVDTLAFGLIPDKVGEKFGARKLTSADEIGGMIGSTAGLFVPGIGPMAVGSKIASKVLPKVAKIGAEGSMLSNVLAKGTGEGVAATVGEAGTKGLGAVTKWLESPMAAARVGSAIGAGFNFEDGINPMGAALGAFFPAGVKGLGAVSKVDDVSSVSSKIDAVTSKAAAERQALYGEAQKVMKQNIPPGVQALPQDSIAWMLPKMGTEPKAKLIQEIAAEAKIDPAVVGQSIEMLVQKFPQWKLKDLISYFTGKV